MTQEQQFYPLVESSRDTNPDPSVIPHAANLQRHLSRLDLLCKLHSNLRKAHQCWKAAKKSVNPVHPVHPAHVVHPMHPAHPSLPATEFQAAEAWLQPVQQHSSGPRQLRFLPAVCLAVTEHQFAETEVRLQNQPILPNPCGRGPPGTLLQYMPTKINPLPEEEALLSLHSQLILSETSKQPSKRLIVLLQHLLIYLSLGITLGTVEYVINVRPTYNFRVLGQAP